MVVQLMHAKLRCHDTLPAAGRYVGGSGSKRAGKLLPALLKTQQELKLCSMEPAWWCTCTVELPAWQGILGQLDILACYLCSLESLLAGAPCLWPLSHTLCLRDGASHEQDAYESVY